MKQRYFLLAIFFIGITSAHAQFLAKDGISAATATVTAVASDAVLIEIASFEPVTDLAFLNGSDGLSNGWTYEFYSVSNNLVYNVECLCGLPGCMPVPFLSTTYIPNFPKNPGTLLTTRSWINSDAALKIADGAGGSVFFLTNGLNTSITMNILDDIGDTTYDGTTLETVDSLGWTILYSTSDASLIICVNAESGVVVCKTPSNGSGVVEESADVQLDLDQLNQNFPNPFDASTAISFSLPRSQNVTLRVYNSLGSEVADLADGEISEGAHTFNFDAANLPAGIYYYRLMANGVAQTKPMMVVK